MPDFDESLASARRLALSYTGCRGSITGQTMDGWTLLVVPGPPGGCDFCQRDLDSDHPMAWLDVEALGVVVSWGTRGAGAAPIPGSLGRSGLEKSCAVL